MIRVLCNPTLETLKSVLNSHLLSLTTNQLLISAVNYNFTPGPDFLFVFSSESDNLRSGLVVTHTASDT